MTRVNKATSENGVKNVVKEILDYFGWFSWANSAGPYSVHGLPDRMAVGNGGVFIAIECKQGTNTTTANQRAFLSKLEDKGIRTFVVRDAVSVHWFVDYLKFSAVDHVLDQ